MICKGILGVTLMICREVLGVTLMICRGVLGVTLTICRGVLGVTPMKSKFFIRAHKYVIRFFCVKIKPAIL